MSSQDKAGSPGGKGTKTSPAIDPNLSQSSPAAASSNTSTPRPSPTSTPTPGLDKASANPDSGSASSSSNKDVVDISSSTSTSSDSGSDSDEDSSLFDSTVSDSDDNRKQQPNAKSPLSKKQRTKPPPSRVGMQYAYFGVTADNNDHWILTNFVSNEGPDLIKIVDADTDDCRFILQCYLIFYLSLVHVHLLF